METEKNPLEIWYKDGLKFSCTQCGKCCGGSPGYAWVTEEEIQTIAEYLKISLEEFAKKYLRKVHGRWSLLEYSKTYDCIFLKEKKCSIYPVRPQQCRTFPWWTENLSSKEAWDETAERCEGIHEDASLVPFEEIEKAKSE
ncbi:MAG: hypothetical protein JWO53_803 [Chlamydiia bacterium]|nr:hypothetical protein [Chlamydiia bacterium]